MKHPLLLLALPVLLALSGCAHVLSREAVRSVDRGIDYAAVKADPVAYKDRTLLLGGSIVQSASSREGSTLEVFRYTLDRWGEPRRADEVAGRFIARTDRFLDPELYKPGRFVTLTGVVVGEEKREVSGVPYTYPLFRIGEIYPWPQPAPGYVPPVRGYMYYNYYPYGPYYDPWWPSPFYRYRSYDRDAHHDRDHDHDDGPASGGWHGSGHNR